MPTATFSELLRSPKEVAAAAERGEVTITRRDGEDLVLTTAATVQANRAGLEFAAEIVASAVAEWPGSFAHRLRQPFPWMTFLSDAEQDVMAKEIVDIARACAGVGRFEPLAIKLSAWRATAEAYAAGVPRDNADLTWLDGNGDVVERPEA
ncbi:hypothetical protein [Cellulomonas bogoriensis]|uniref:Prevent-host-death protein n=1 Tax=Cellulomonas bogoriensis 69B4 = DSM 16987 TaxID=1386082 RepID=A0A0A0BZ21_9CELL|nr:hypothetical protein [Cellulomonas bogoriensis]KGM13185.1 prevent-host-death protein [Cellulomonas bogoriensis 69B4 = DSM 16987]